MDLVKCSLKTSQIGNSSDFSKRFPLLGGCTVSCSVIYGFVIRLSQVIYKFCVYLHNIFTIFNHVVTRVVTFILP